MTKEYIEREKLLQDIEHYHLSDGKFQHWVEIQPAADVVEVVRCKDCKHYAAMVTDTVSGELETATWGICTKPWFNSDEYDVHEDDYCSYSERKMDKEK